TDMRRIPEARGRFDQAEGLYPGDAEVQFRLGAFLAAEALPQSAGTDFRNDPSTKEATWRSIYDKAVRHLERSVSLQSDQAEAHRVLLYLHLRAGEYALAIQSGQRTLAKDSRDAASRYNLGLAYYYSRQYAQARTHFQEVLRAHPNTEYARLFFANACMRLGDLDVAIENFNRVLEQNSANSEAHVNLWRIYSARGESDAARTHQARACATGVPEACQDCEGCDERARPD
ncbi:MAG: tetratricopeptide repeat protein, partial [Leptospirales bacterium]